MVVAGQQIHNTVGKSSQGSNGFQFPELTDVKRMTTDVELAAIADKSDSGTNDDDIRFDNPCLFVVKRATSPVTRSRYQQASHPRINDC
ncbi:hypothetical protein ACI65C_002821 [Semiaphis heraclei]